MLSCQQFELVVVKGESVLLSGEGLPYDGINLHGPHVDAGDHIGLHRRNPAKETLGGLAMAGPLDLVNRSRDLLKLSLPGELVVSDPGVVADNIQVDLVHSSPLPAELGDNLPVRGDGDTKLEVRGICGHLWPGKVDGEVLATGQVHGVAGLLGGGVKVNSGLFLAVEPEGLGGSCAGDLHGLELWKVGLKLQLLARGVPGRHGQLILANKVPGDGDQTSDGLAEPDQGVGGGPGVQREVAESLTIQHKFVFNKELSKEEVPVLLVVGDSPGPLSILVVFSNVEVVQSIERTHGSLNNLVHGLELKLVGVVDPAVVSNPVPDGRTSPLQVSGPLASAGSGVLPLISEKVVFGESIRGPEELVVLLGLGVVKDKLGCLLTINCHDGVHCHLWDKEEALVDFVEEDGHLPLDSLAVSASVPEDHAIEGRLLSHSHLVKVLHLKLGSIVGLDIKDHLALLDDDVTMGDLVSHGETSISGVLPASLVGPWVLHVVGKVGEEEGSLGGGVVVLDVVPCLSIKDHLFFNLHLVQELGLLNLVKEDIPGLVHLLHVPSSEEEHGVEVVEGILLGLSKSLIGFELKLVAIVDPGEITSNFLNKNTVHLEIRVVLEPSREIEIEDVLEWSASLGGEADLEPLGRGPCIKLQFGLSLVLLSIVDVVLHDIVEHDWEHA